MGIIALRWLKFQCTSFRPESRFAGDTYIELPIFQETLRASGDWRTGLESIRAWWSELQGDPARLHTFKSYWARVSQGETCQENFLAGLEFVFTWSQAAESTLSTPSILDLNSMLFPEASGFRTTEAKRLSEAHDPPLAILVERLVNNAVGWFGTEGFAEMNPVEQSALVYLRFTDLQAFATGNDIMAALLASHPLLKAGLPPLIIQSGDPRHQAALDSALRMLTQHLVNFIAETLSTYPAIEF